MKLNHLVIILAIVLVNVGFAKAEKPTSINPQTQLAKSVVEVEEPTGALTPIGEKIEKHDLEPTFNNSSLFDSGNLNLSFQLNDQPDSIDFSVIEYYIKHVMPFDRKVDSKEVDLLEIL